MVNSRELTILDRARAGRVLTVFADEALEVRSSTVAAAEARTPIPTIVSVHWQQAPPLDHELTRILDTLAEAALGIWPKWYLTSDARYARKRSVRQTERALAKARKAAPSLSAAWFRLAWQACARGELPRLSEMAAAEQLRQLALSLDPSGPIILLLVSSPEATPTRCHALARASEWLATHAEVPVVLVVPSAWDGVGELDAVSYGAVYWNAESLRPPPDESPLRDSGSRLKCGDQEAAEASSTKTSQQQNAGESAALTHLTSRQPAKEATTPRAPERGTAWRSASAREEYCNERGRDESPLEVSAEVQVEPVMGRPHPGSDAEQKLESWLQRDPELRDELFFNRRVVAHGNLPYRVDLLWQQGSVVVEVDGDSHRRPGQYQDDRERDYRLLLAGYTVLRITNGEVLSDTARAVEKIRNVMRLKRSTLQVAR